MLQEKLQAAERRAQTAERAVKEESGVHNEVSQLKLQAQAWENTAKTLGLDSPGEVFQKLEELRSQCLTAAAAIGQKDAELRETEGLAQDQMKHDLSLGIASVQRKECSG